MRTPETTPPILHDTPLKLKMEKVRRIYQELRQRNELRATEDWLFNFSYLILMLTQVNASPFLRLHTASCGAVVLLWTSKHEN